MTKGKPRGNKLERYKPGDEIPDHVQQWFGEHWCGCGYSDEAMTFLREALTMFTPNECNGYSVDLGKLDEFEAKYTKGGTMFVLYMLDGTGVLEHGGSVVGAWMTTLGRDLKDFLEANPDYEV